MVTQASVKDSERVMRISLTLDIWRMFMVVRWDPEKYCHSGVDSSAGLKKLIPKGDKPKLILTDPPYNLGFDYGNVNDSMKNEDYHKMLLKVFDSAYHAADDNAHLFIINYPEIISRMWNDVIEPKTKSGQTRKKPYWKFHQWVTWCYPNNWPPQKNRFTRASRAIIWMTKGKPKTDLKNIVQPYRNPWDKRVKGLMQEGKRGPAFYDWWDRIDLCKNVSEDKSKEPPYSNQMPELLLKRIISITTASGDLVADPFAGTFSTVKAALDLGRIGWGCDLNKDTQIYHPKLQEIEINPSDKNHINQQFDIDWMKEPFDISRAGLSPDKFYKSLVTSIGVYPDKQRILLLSEIVRLHNYSGDWNAGSVSIESINLLEIFIKIPKIQIDEILAHMNQEINSNHTLEEKANQLIAGIKDSLNLTTNKMKPNPQKTLDIT